MPQPLNAKNDLFSLRVKYGKVTLFMPVSPKTTYDELINDVLAGLATSAHTPPAETGASSFKEMGPSDVGLFEGSKMVGTADGQQDESIRFVQVDREQPNLEEMGIIDGPDAIVYLGFRDASKGVIAEPVVEIPALVDDFDEEDDEAAEAAIDDEMEGIKERA
ncbi:hypothetical protein FA10DRAFT_66069 [Acaromyces ingoldii]|uniref:Uncharacterized protein n=1 Tax=Acaromyces ingoldii TaxID=215250 RepID=A0A316YRU7_9BASI|nr:hypothetical protein FA10DRAFT_66069 [Acaromyces ingoldii]PWN91388.1 hypothetical protein FA10DRAFT_66069 [Acaromyces ingoldii]